jgi:carbonic anhydrase
VHRVVPTRVIITVTSSASHSSPNQPHTPAAPSEPFEPSADELIANNRRFAETFTTGCLQVAPTRHLAVVTCMDSRIDLFESLGLDNGEAHFIRNAGGVVTDDVIRSLCLSQRLLGTREILLVHHTDCGLQSVSEDAFKAELEAEVGMKPCWALESFDDPFADVLQSVQRLRHTPFLQHKGHIRGFVYDVTTGRLHEVPAPPDTE